MLFQTVSRKHSRLTVLVVAGLLGAAAASAHAETGSASAADVSVHINLLGVAQLNVDAQAPVNIDGVVDATYQQNSLPGLDTGGTLLHLSTATLWDEGEFLPGVSISASGGNVEVEDLDLSALSLIGNSLISMTADAIQSRSQVTGYCVPSNKPHPRRQMFDDIQFYNGFDAPNLNPGTVDGDPNPDDVTLTGLGISILGIPVPDLPTNPDPNTSIDLQALGIVGATLILNEQTVSGDGVNMSQLSTNAVHLTLDVAGLVTADVVVGHSMARIDCTE